MFGTLLSSSARPALLSALTFALISVSSGCTKIASTQLTIVLFADEEIEGEIASVALDIFGSAEGEAPLLTEALRLTADDFPASVALIPLGGDASRRFGAEARALDQGERLRAIVRARGSYVEDEARTAYLRFDAECLDILDCSDDESCSLGRCVDSELAREDYGALEPEGGYKLPPRTMRDRAVIERGGEVRLNPLKNDIDPNGGALRLLAIGYEREDDEGALEIEFSEDGETLLRSLGRATSELELVYTIENDAGIRARGLIHITQGEAIRDGLCAEGEWMRIVDASATLAQCLPLTECEAHQRQLVDDLPTDGTSREDRRCCHHHFGEIVLGGDTEGEGQGWPEFEEDCLYVEGDVYYAGVSYTPAKGGEALIHVEGNVSADYVAIENLSALKGLYSFGREFGGYLSITDCPELVDLHGLESLTGIPDELRILNNPRLMSISAFSSLRELRYLWMQNLPSLTSLRGLESVTIMQTLVLERVDAIVDLSGLDNLVEIESNFYLLVNASISSLKGLENLERVGSLIQSHVNPALCESEIHELAARSDPPPTVEIVGAHATDCP